MKSKIQITVYILMIFSIFSSCDSFKDAESYDYEEATKNIDGVWQLKTVSRNGIDISDTWDFSRFRLNLNTDGSYTMDNYLPFVVKKNGQWQVDDVQYPFNLTFRESGSSEDVTIALRYPIENGKRIISVTIAPGCYSNSYTYVFEKISN